MPWSLQEKVLWDFDDHKCADSLISWLKAKVRVAASWKVGGKEMHVVEDEYESLRKEINELGVNMTEEQLMAFAERRAVRPRDAQRSRPGPRQGQELGPGRG